LSRFTLRADARWVEVETEFDNRARDHRLRLRVATGLNAQDPGIRAFGETSFWVQERPIHPEGSELPVEPQKEAIPTAFPQQGWSAIEGDWGVMVAAHGIHEAEVVIREAGDLALDLTLIRGVGWLSRDDLRTRGGGAGPAMETPEAQCLGPHRFMYAVMPYRGPWTVAMPLALGYLAPPVAQPCGAHRAARSGGLSVGKWLSIGDDRVVVSTVKPAEDGSGTILRLFNPTDRYFETELEITLPHQALIQTRIDETDLAVLGQGKIPLRMGPAEIQTIRIRPVRDA
jgi:alpha-mannosidase